jgi:cytochrome c-type biogenesis protein CcmE
MSVDQGQEGRPELAETAEGVGILPVDTNPASRTRVWVAAVLILGALGFVVFRGLGDAAVYFLTADEAVAQRADLGERRFRVQGEVVAGSVRNGADGVDFRIRENGETVQVRHQGDPPELFQPGIPVVLEGRWAGETFASDRILVRHSEEYRADNPERVEDYPG